VCCLRTKLHCTRDRHILALSSRSFSFVLFSSDERSQTRDRELRINRAYASFILRSDTRRCSPATSPERSPMALHTDLTRRFGRRLKRLRPVYVSGGSVSVRYGGATVSVGLYIETNDILVRARAHNSCNVCGDFVAEDRYDGARARARGALILDSYDVFVKAE